jgi:hypothetical protein
MLPLMQWRATTPSYAVAWNDWFKMLDGIQVVHRSEPDSLVMVVSVGKLTMALLDNIAIQDK